MGQAGMADMATMKMPLPENTLPMMMGEGPFGGLEMGGMFSVVKVRRNQKRGDYGDPGWFTHPKGSQAWEWTGAPLAEPVRAKGSKPAPEADIAVRKPGGHHHEH